MMELKCYCINNTKKQLKPHEKPFNCNVNGNVVHTRSMRVIWQVLWYHMIKNKLGTSREHDALVYFQLRFTYELKSCNTSFFLVNKLYYSDIIIIIDTGWSIPIIELSFGGHYNIVIVHLINEYWKYQFNTFRSFLYLGDNIIIEVINSIFVSSKYIQKYIVRKSCLIL